MTIKTCPKCNRGLPPNDFYPAANALGLSSYCRECQKAAAAARYTPREPWPRPCQICGTVFTVKGKANLCSPECKRKKDAARGRAKPRKRPPGRDKRLRNTPKDNLRAHRRRTRLAGNGVFALLPREVDRLYTEACAYCGGPGGTMDHRIPIARGGRHAIGNLSPCCPQCNSSKGARLLVEWRYPR